MPIRSLLCFVFCAIISLQSLPAMAAKPGQSVMPAASLNDILIGRAPAADECIPYGCTFVTRLFTMGHCKYVVRKTVSCKNRTYHLACCEN